MTIMLTPVHHDLTYLAPLSPGRARRFVSHLIGAPLGTVLDLGCGWAELLIEAVEQAPGSRGTGVDMAADAIERGRDLAVQRGLSDRIELVIDRAEEFPGGADAVICIGASHIWAPPGDEVGPMPYARALDAIRAKVDRGARVLYGEAIWSAPPTVLAMANLGGRSDEHLMLADLADLVAAAGFMPMAIHEASQAEWDEFESGYSVGYARWLAEHEPDHPDAAEVRERAASQRAGYLRGYRGVLGMAYFELVAV